MHIVRRQISCSDRSDAFTPATMILYLILAFATTTAETQIEDIPIQNYYFQNADLQNDAVDFELMPRFPRSFPISEEDPKDYFFNAQYNENYPKEENTNRYRRQVENVLSLDKPDNAMDYNTPRFHVSIPVSPDDERQYFAIGDAVADVLKAVPQQTEDSSETPLDNIQNNNIDVKLMPEFQVPQTNYEPEEFFSRISSQEVTDIPSLDSVVGQGTDKEVVPKKTFGRISSNWKAMRDNVDDELTTEHSNIRIRRDALDTTSSRTHGNNWEGKSIIRRLGKPLELAVIDPESLVKQADEVSAPSGDKTNEENHVINDFIRFRRAASPEKMEEDVMNVKSLMDELDAKNSSNTNVSDAIPKPPGEEMPQPEKLMMDAEDADKDGGRDVRGATKEQWVKQAYPVRRSGDPDDNSQASTEKENVRAPRVHFVTQGMSESALRPEYDGYNRYDREARARSLNRELSWSLSRDPYREMDTFQPRYTRNYSPPAQQYYRDDRYSGYEPREPWDDYPSRLPGRYRDYPDRLPRESYNKGRQRRIIYYATLPDISRTPPNVDLRDRYQYRNRYEDRYFSPEPSYQLRQPYTKPRYPEADNRKPQYPLKVSTDVNVRDVKKTPERRIYSEVESGSYSQNPPYRNDRV